MRQWRSRATKDEDIDFAQLAETFGDFDDEQDYVKVLEDLWHHFPIAEPFEFERAFRYSVPKELGKVLWHFVPGAFDSIALAPEKSSCLIDRLISFGDEVRVLHESEVALLEFRMEIWGCLLRLIPPIEKQALTDKRIAIEAAGRLMMCCDQSLNFCGDAQSMVFCVAAIGGEELISYLYRAFLPMIDDTAIGKIMRLFLSCQEYGASDRFH